MNGVPSGPELLLAVKFVAALLGIVFVVVTLLELVQPYDDSGDEKNR